MALTSVSMTLGLGIMDEPDQSSIETDAVSSLSVLIIAVNVVFALCMLFEIMVEVHKKVTKKLRTKELWASTRRKKNVLIAILKLGSPQCRNSSSDDNRDNSSTESLSLVMAQKRGKNALKTKKAEAAEGDAIEMTENAAMKNDASAASIFVRKRREFLVCKSEPEGETYYADNATGETTWELPDDAFIMAEEGCTLDLGQAPQPSEDPPCEDTPQRRLHQFSVSVTEGGDEYFINNETQETAWYLPDGGKVVEI